MTQNYQLSLPFLEDYNSRLVAIEQKLDEIIKPNPSKDKLLNTKEAAQALGVSRRTLQEKRRRSEISFIQHGDIVRLRPCDIQQYLEAHYINIKGKKGGKNE